MIMMMIIISAYVITPVDYARCYYGPIIETLLKLYSDYNKTNTVLSDIIETVLYLYHALNQIKCYVINPLFTMRFILSTVVKRVQENKVHPKLIQV